MSRPLRLIFGTLLLAALGLMSATATPATAQSTDLQSPADFLGYEMGSQFTPHHRVMDYVEHVAAASPNVEAEPYGESYEGRTLMVAYISNPDLLAERETIRQDNLRRIGLEDGAPTADDAPAIVYLSYNVHGNESVSTESAMQTLYELADPTNDQTQPWLDNTLVLLDPLVNPDGRARYVNFYRESVGAQPNTRRMAREHQEPWPGGRANHYYFDLNRDWAWASQQETQHRLQLYNRWMPHVHVDYHEQGIDSPHYFAPAADPFHEDIAAWQREIQTEIGRNHARYFDENGWRYFTRERFDLFYPGYGDTWPTFNGAIGMTYEQGGSGRAGLMVHTVEGDTLSLRDRFVRHHATGLSTVETAAREADRLVDEFVSYHETAASNPPGDYSAYLVKARDDDEGVPGTRDDRIHALHEHLEAQGIASTIAGDGTDTQRSGLRYADQTEQSAAIEPGDLVVSLNQPKGRLAKVLMEPRTTVVDSVTYDMTGWSLPYAYGLEAYALEQSVSVSGDAEAAPPTLQGADTERPYAYLANWHSIADASFLSDLIEADVKVRFAREAFDLNGRTFEPGTLAILRTNNRNMGADFDRIVQETAAEHERSLYRTATGFMDEEPDLGSGNIRYIDAPHVGVLAGAPLASLNVGEVWHFFEQQLGYPATLLEPGNFRDEWLSDLDVLIMPSGSYGDWLTEERTEALQRWIQNGGHVIALGAANSALSGRDGFDLAAPSADEDSADASPELNRYEDRAREAATRGTPGSVHATTLDGSHPLAFGIERYFTLKRSARAFAYLDSGWTVAALEDTAPLTGFMGHEAQQELDDTLVFGVQSHGQGRITYLVDNPLTRGFWHNGQLLMSNAVFFVGNE